jgi:DNA polymerase-1
MADKKRLVLIDGKSVFYRGYYAMPNLSTKDGTPTGGVYGFATLSLEVIKRLKPDFVAVAWDKPKTNIRKRLEIYPQYKAGRKPAPADFYAQVPILHELLDSLGWPLYELDDYEADDIMAGLAKKADSKGIETILITSDLDALQCISEHTKVYALKKGLSNIEQFHPESFTAKYGLSPNQFLDLKALQGDSSDNIPGVPGVGAKTASALLQKYITLDGIYENIELVSGSIKEKLIAGKESAYLSKKLATLFTDAPLELDLKAMDVHNFNGNKLRQNLEKLEFRAILRQLNDLPINGNHNLTIKDSNTTVVTGKPLPKLIDASKADLKSPKELFVYACSRKANGIDPICVVVGTSEWVTIINAKDFIAYKKYFSKPLVGYNIKSTLKTLFMLGLTDFIVGHDVQVGAFIINSLERNLQLTDLADQIGLQATDLYDVPAEDIGEFAPGYIAALVALTANQRKELSLNPKLSTLCTSVEWPVLAVLAKMEQAGIALDSEYLNKMARMLQDQISDIEQTIYGYADQEFNISSPQQLASVLFDDMGLPTHGIKKGKTGYSTAASELDKLRELNPIIDQISLYREYTKLKSTYVDTLPQQVAQDGRVHTTFNVTVAQTGRLSSADPNLQNIPVRSDLGRQIRTAFVASPGCVFVSADYSQFELRLAAVLAGDLDMVDAFNSGADIHTRTAAEVYGVALDDVTSDMRSNAKIINFGVLYGMSPHGLAVATGMTMSDAKNFIDRYFAARQPLVNYIDNLKKLAKEQGYVETLFGRRRPTPDVNSSNFVVREAAFRQAVNMPIQGTEADLMKMAMIKLDQKLAAFVESRKMETENRKEQSPLPITQSLAPIDIPRQLLQIHDSILVECPEPESIKVSDIMKQTMEQIYPEIGIHLKVDVKIGKNWGEI